jgi:opacity protein-like surface antigen
MSRRSRFILAAGLVAMLAPLPCFAWVVVPPRAGQVGIGMQGQGGMMFESGSLGTDYDSGSGLTVRLRYRMRYERGLGLSFESQSFDARRVIAPDVEGDPYPVKLHFFTAGPEVYQMFGTRTRTHKMLSLGAGLAKIAVKLSDDETSFPTAGDGVYVSAGAGVEHFVWQSWAIDLSTRYMAVFHDQKPNHDVQAALGLIFYASY